MQVPGPALDPSPHRPLPSDIAFKLWLRTLLPEVVELDRRAGMWRNQLERLYLEGASGPRPRHRVL